MERYYGECLKLNCDFYSFPVTLCYKHYHVILQYVLTASDCINVFISMYHAIFVWCCLLGIVKFCEMASYHIIIHIAIHIMMTIKIYIISWVPPYHVTPSGEFRQHYPRDLLSNRRPHNQRFQDVPALINKSLRCLDHNPVPTMINPMCQAIIWTSARLLLIGTLGTTFGKICITIQQFSFMKMNLKMSSAK